MEDVYWRELTGIEELTSIIEDSTIPEVKDDIVIVESGSTPLVTRKTMSIIVSIAIVVATVYGIHWGYQTLTAEAPQLAPMPAYTGITSPDLGIHATDGKYNDTLQLPDDFFPKGK